MCHIEHIKPRARPCSKLHFPEYFFIANVKVIFNGFIKSFSDMFKQMSCTIYFTLTVDKFYKVYKSESVKIV